MVVFAWWSRATPFQHVSTSAQGVETACSFVSSRKSAALPGHFYFLSFVPAKNIRPLSRNVTHLRCVKLFSRSSTGIRPPGSHIGVKPALLDGQRTLRNRWHSRSPRHAAAGRRHSLCHGPLFGRIPETRPRQSPCPDRHGHPRVR